MANYFDRYDDAPLTSAAVSSAPPPADPSADVSAPVYINNPSNPYRDTKAPPGVTGGTASQRTAGTGNYFDRYDVQPGDGPKGDSWSGIAANFGARANEAITSPVDA